MFSICVADLFQEFIHLLQRQLTFICFISSYICSGGKLATALEIASGAFSGSTGSPNGLCRNKAWLYLSKSNLLGHGSLCVCVHTMGEDVTMKHHLSLARHIHKMIPARGHDRPLKLGSCYSFWVTQNSHTVVSGPWPEMSTKTLHCAHTSIMAAPTACCIAARKRENIAKNVCFNRNSYFI